MPKSAVCNISQPITKYSRKDKDKKIKDNIADTAHFRETAKDDGAA